MISTDNGATTCLSNQKEMKFSIFIWTFLFFIIKISKAETPLTIGTCKTDQDCLSFTLRLHQLPKGSIDDTHSGYTCINDTCSYVVR